MLDTRREGWRLTLRAKPEPAPVGDSSPTLCEICAPYRRHHAFVPAGMEQRKRGSSGQRQSPPPGRCGQA